MKNSNLKKALANFNKVANTDSDIEIINPELVKGGRIGCGTKIKQCGTKCFIRFRDLDVDADL